MSVPQGCCARVHKSLWQECPTRVFHKSVRQECPTRVPHKSECHRRAFHKSVPQGCPTRMRPTRVSRKCFQQECPTRVSHRVTKVSHESVPQERSTIVSPTRVSKCLGHCFRARVCIRVCAHVFFHDVCVTSQGSEVVAMSYCKYLDCSTSARILIPLSSACVTMAVWLLSYHNTRRTHLPNVKRSHTPRNVWVKVWLAKRIDDHNIS